MKRQYFFILLLFFITESYSQFNEIQNFQKKIIEQEITGSNTAMIFKDGKTIYYNIENSGKKGDKNISNQSYKPNLETIFPIWSMSKPITIVAMMILKEKGMININDNLSKYIPEFKNMTCKGENGEYPCKNEIKVIHLLTHRSGFGYYSNPGYGYGFTSSLAYNNLKDFAQDLSKVALEFEPGEKYFYGLNQALLGRVVEIVYKKSFYDFLKDEIFDPLKMTETKFHLTENDRSRFQPLFINTGELKGFTYELNELTYSKENKAFFGGEGLVSTMSDYSNFCRMLLNGGVFNNKRIISQKSIDLMTRKYSDSYPIEEYADIRKLGFYFGFSLFVLENPEIDGTNSSKGIYGWSGYHNTHFWIDPEKNLYGLFMSRSRQGVSNIDVQKEFRRLVYKSLK
jgi:CubicO group peptidase (beta-lactamase class C family)